MRSNIRRLSVFALMLVLNSCAFMQAQSTEHDTVHTTYSDDWQTVSGAAVDTNTPPSDSNAGNTSASTNKRLVHTDDSGNREYLFVDSIRTQNNVLTALVEYRYAHTQILPETGRSYTHNHWLEQIDCVHHIRSIRATTQYNANNQIVDANEYAVPRYSKDDLKMLAKPDDPVIVEVCRMANKNNKTPEINAASAVSTSSTPVAASTPAVMASAPAAASETTAPTHSASAASAPPKTDASLFIP